VVGSAGAVAYKIKEIKNNQDISATDLNNGKVYTFSLKNSENLESRVWYKYPYRSDEYLIPGEVTSNKLRVRFHRTNTTFFPKLKTSQGSFPIKKLDGLGNIASLSKGYISTNLVYILTRNSSNWIIREFTPENVSSPLPTGERTHPKRSCMTTRISSTGAENISWSLPNSSCVNYCPGYVIIDGIGVGDNRIGVGATKHQTSQGEGIVYWDDTPAGETRTKKFSIRRDIRNENDNYVVFQEVNDILPTSDFRMNSNRQYFALSRKCNLDGSWEAPESLCAYNISSNSNQHGIPSNPATGTSYITSGETPQGYIIAGSSDQSQQVQSHCISGYYPQTSERYLYQNAGEYSVPKYNCVKHVNEDRVYFNEVPDQTRRSCIKYCEVSDQTHIKFPSITGKNNYKVRIGDSIQLECNTGAGYLSSLSADGITRSGLKPILTCIDNNLGTVDFSNSIQNNCTLANRCRYSSLTSAELNQLTMPAELLTPNSNPLQETLRAFKIIQWNIDNQRTARYVSVDKYWFPLSKFIAKKHRDNGMDHGKIHTLKANSYNSVAGNCGYCNYIGKWAGCCVKSEHWYKRKFLKSYSCNDGIWYAEWNNQDDNPGLACDNDPWDWDNWQANHWEWGGDDHHTGTQLGWCTEQISETSSFNNITLWDNAPDSWTETSF
jgi:hypothetical protein